MLLNNVFKLPSRSLDGNFFNFINSGENVNIKCELKMRGELR